MREAEIQDLGYSIGGRNISNALYADDTALIAQSPMEMQQLLDKVNAAVSVRKGFSNQMSKRQNSWPSEMCQMTLPYESTTTHGETKNVWTNHLVERSVHPSRAENETG